MIYFALFIFAIDSIEYKNIDFYSTIILITHARDICWDMYYNVDKWETFIYWIDNDILC